MTAPSIPIVVALAGTAVGGLTSFFGAWLGQYTHVKSQLALNDKSRRQELYRDFVNEASTYYINALLRNRPDLIKAASLYALIGRMRVISSPEVIEEAKAVLQSVSETYNEPNKSLGDIMTMVNDNACDPLRRFSDICRAELDGLSTAVRPARISRLADVEQTTDRRISLRPSKPLRENAI